MFEEAFIAENESNRAALMKDQEQDEEIVKDAY